MSGIQIVTVLTGGLTFSVRYSDGELLGNPVLQYSGQAAPIILVMVWFLDYGLNTLPFKYLTQGHDLNTTIVWY